MSTKELQEKLTADMQTWQKIEDAAIEIAEDVISKTDNAVIKLVMEVIQSDSRTHRKVQEFVESTFTEKAVNLSTDDLANVWDVIQKHNDTEKKMLGNVIEALDALKGKKMIVQEYFLNYLKADEEKHNDLLAALEKVKGGVYPYA